MHDHVRLHIRCEDWHRFVAWCGDTEHGQLVQIYRQMLKTNEVDRVDELNTVIGLALTQITNLVATLEAFPLTLDNAIQVADLLTVAENSLAAIKVIMT